MNNFSAQLTTIENIAVIIYVAILRHFFHWNREMNRLLTRPHKPVAMDVSALNKGDVIQKNEDIGFCRQLVITNIGE